MTSGAPFRRSQVGVLRSRVPELERQATIRRGRYRMRRIVAGHPARKTHGLRRRVHSGRERSSERCRAGAARLCSRRSLRRRRRRAGMLCVRRSHHHEARAVSQRRRQSFRQGLGASKSFRQSYCKKVLRNVKGRECWKHSRPFTRLKFTGRNRKKPAASSPTTARVVYSGNELVESDARARAAGSVEMIARYDSNSCTPQTPAYVSRHPCPSSRRSV